MQMEKKYSDHSDICVNTFVDFDLSNIEEIVKKSKEKQEEVRMKILESSKMAVRSLRDTEDIAVSTLRDLHCQSEQLVKTKKNLDELDSSLKQNHQLMNKIKSPFGFLKNFVNNKQESLQNWKKKKHFKCSTCPSLSKSSLHGNNLKDSPPHSTSVGFNVTNKQVALSGKCSRSKMLDRLLDDDLDEISSSVARLKTLALEMGNEVEMQNENLDHIINKSDKVSVVLKKHNATMKTMIG